MVKPAKRRSIKKLAKTKQKSAQKAPSGMASNRMLIILYVLVAIALGWLMIHIVRTNYERQQYNHARANLNALYDEIVTAVGKPDKTKDDARCGYVSQEFGDGPRYCNVYKYFAYKGIDHDRAIDLNRRINNVIKDSKAVKFKKTTDSTGIYSGVKELQATSFETAGLEECGSDVVYVPAGATDDYSSISGGGFIAGDGLKYSLSCSGGSQKEYFPVKN